MNLSHKSISELEQMAKSHKNRMRLILFVFIACIVGIALTVWMVLNNYQFLWFIPFAIVMAGQWWLANGGRWRK